MINKNLKKILNENQLKNFKDLNLELRPSDMKPNFYYKVVELLEKK